MSFSLVVGVGTGFFAALLLYTDVSGLIFLLAYDEERGSPEYAGRGKSELGFVFSLDVLALYGM